MLLSDAHVLKPGNTFCIKMLNNGNKSFIEPHKNAEMRSSKVIPLFKTLAFKGRI